MEHDQLNNNKKTKKKEAGSGMSEDWRMQDLPEAGRLNLTLPPELNDKLFHYIMEWSKQRGKIPPQGLKTSIGRQALREWLTKHEKDYAIEVDPQ